eukprot:gene18706-24465_t
MSSYQITSPWEIIKLVGKGGSSSVYKGRFTDTGVVKLADFGASKKYESESIVSGLKGTPNWMAPEVIRGTQMTSGWMKADVWSVGCTIVEMLTAKLPFSEYDNPMTAMYHIANGKSPSIQNVDCSDDLKEFIHICCSPDPEIRPNISELVKYKLFNKSTNNTTPDKQKMQSNNSNYNQTNSSNESTNNPITNESNQHNDSINNNTIEEISEDEYLQEIFHDDEIDIDISTDDEISETSSVNNASYIEEEPPNDDNEQTYVFTNHIDTNSHSVDIATNDVDSKLDKQITCLSLEDALTPNIHSNTEYLDSSRVSTAIYSPDSRKVSIGSPQTVAETTESVTTRINEKTNNVNFDIQDSVIRPVAPMSSEHIRISNQSDDNTVTTNTTINKSKSSHKIPPSHSSSSTSTGRTLTSIYRKKLLKVRSKSAGMNYAMDHYIGKPKCKSLLRGVCRNCTKFAIDDYSFMYGDDEGIQTRGDYWYAVPFPSNFHWSRYVQRPFPWENNDRPVLVSYIGTGNSFYAPARRLRGSLIHYCELHPTLCIHQNYGKEGTRSSFLVEGYNPLQVSSRSTFCFQPIGDLMTRKGLFDSLLQGCIPVLFDPLTAEVMYTWHWDESFWKEISINLPFHPVAFRYHDPVSMKLHHSESFIGNWPVYSDGSPMRDAYDIAIDHALGWHSGRESRYRNATKKQYDNK